MRNFRAAEIISVCSSHLWEESHAVHFVASKVLAANWPILFVSVVSSVDLPHFSHREEKRKLIFLWKLQGARAQNPPSTEGGRHSSKPLSL